MRNWVTLCLLLVVVCVGCGTNGGDDGQTVLVSAPALSGDAPAWAQVSEHWAEINFQYYQEQEYLGGDVAEVQCVILVGCHTTNMRTLPLPAVIVVRPSLLDGGTTPLATGHEILVASDDAVDRLCRMAAHDTDQLPSSHDFWVAGYCDADLVFKGFRPFVCVDSDDLWAQLGIASAVDSEVNRLRQAATDER